LQGEQARRGSQRVTSYRSPPLPDSGWAARGTEFCDSVMQRDPWEKKNWHNVTRPDRNLTDSCPTAIRITSDVA